MYSEPVTSSDIPLRSEALERMKLWKTPLRCLLVGISGVGKSSAVNTIMHVLLGNTHLVLYAMAVNGVHKGMPGTTWHTNCQYLTLMDTCNDFIDLQKDDIFVSGITKILQENDPHIALVVANANSFLGEKKNIAGLPDVKGASRLISIIRRARHQCAVHSPLVLLTHKDEIQSDLQEQVIKNAADTLGACKSTIYLWQNYMEQGERLHDTDALVYKLLFQMFSTMPSACGWKIVSAVYSKVSDSTVSQDVKDKLIRASHGWLSIPVSKYNTLIGPDPFPGWDKVLKIVFLQNGQLQEIVKREPEPLEHFLGNNELL